MSKDDPLNKFNLGCDSLFASEKLTRSIFSNSLAFTSVTQGIVEQVNTRYITSLQAGLNVQNLFDKTYASFAVDKSSQLIVQQFANSITASLSKGLQPSLQSINALFYSGVAAQIQSHDWSSLVSQWQQLAPVIDYQSLYSTVSNIRVNSDGISIQPDFTDEFENTEDSASKKPSLLSSEVFLNWVVAFLTFVAFLYQVVQNKANTLIQQQHYEAEIEILNQKLETMNKTYDLLLNLYQDVQESLEHQSASDLSSPVSQSPEQSTPPDSETVSDSESGLQESEPPEQ